MATKASKNSILVLGAGELGNEVIDALYNHPQHHETSLTVLLRPDQEGSPNSSALARGNLVSSLESKGISVVRADIANDSEASLSTIFSDYSTIIGCTGTTYPSGTQLKIAKAILAANVVRYFPWQFGMDYDVIGKGSSQDLFSEQLDVKDLLRAQEKMRWVIVSTGLFMSFLFEPAFGVVSADKGTVTALGGWENEITVTTPRDIGRVVAEIAVADKGVQGVVHIAGYTASYAKIAEIVKKATERKVKKELATLRQLEGELKADPENGMKKYRACFAEGRGVAWPMEQTYNVRKGMHLRDISEYLSNN